MTTELPFDQMIEAVRRGDPAAAEQFWTQFSRRIKGLAQNYLPPSQRRISDPSDVAVSVIDSVLSGIRNDRFPQIEDPDDLWNLVAKITQFKAIEHRRRSTRERNADCHAVAGESAITGPADSSTEQRPIEQIADGQQNPEDVVAIVDEFMHLLDSLDTDDRLIALLRIGPNLRLDVPDVPQEPLTVQQIANLLGTPKRNVERRLQRILIQFRAHFERLRDHHE